MKKLLIIVPCYNEEEILPQTIEALTIVVDNMVKSKKISADSGMLFVNDGSRDKTWQIIKEAHKSNKYVNGVNLANNTGHQNALMAGISVAVDMCDVSISIDADLQDDVSVIEEMVDKYLSGVNIVLGVRSERKTDSFFKRFTAESFYKLMNSLGTKTVYNHADFRLLSKEAMVELLKYKETNLFIRGIISRMSNSYECVYYQRKARTAGESKYPLKKMLAFAWDGITSFSTKPITIIMTLGFVTVLLTIVAALILIFKSTFTTAALCALLICFFSGLQLIAIGLVGQYVGKIYMETKGRPKFHIQEILTSEKNN